MIIAKGDLKGGALIESGYSEIDESLDFYTIIL